jgi:hypothetical protein
MASFHGLHCARMSRKLAKTKHAATGAIRPIAIHPFYPRTGKNKKAG